MSHVQNSPRAQGLPVQVKGEKGRTGRKKSKKNLLGQQIATRLPAQEKPTIQRRNRKR